MDVSHWKCPITHFLEKKPAKQIESGDKRIYYGKIVFGTYKYKHSIRS